MAGIMLPQPRLPQSAVVRLLDYGADISSVMGGNDQRMNRIGSRWQVAITYPRLKPEPDGRVLMSALRQAKTVGALFPVPQPGFDVGNPGSPIANGDGQLGSTINLRGFAAGYTVRDGQFFSIIIGDQRYLYAASGDYQADGNGGLALPIHPMIRLAPNDGAVCEFAQPMIEGTLAGNTVDVELAIARATPATVTITERA